MRITARDPVVVFAGDRNVAGAIAVAVRSLTKVDQDARVAVIVDGWNRDEIMRLGKASRVGGVHVVEATSAGLPAGVGHISSAMYLRLKIPDLLKDEEWAIYLDADTLVRHPISGLITDSGFCESGHSTAGVQDSEVPFLGCSPGLASLRASGFDARLPYINSGFLLMNLDLWRQNNIGTKILEWKRQHIDAWGDNDALHAVLAGNLHLLPLHWNATAHMMRASSPVYGYFDPEEVSRARTDPSVVHFTGAIKPWHSNAAMPFLEEWRAVAAELGWVRFRHSFTVRRRFERWLVRKIDSQGTAS